jgi:thiol-disulfide isomerase/thioredoxin
VLLAAAAFVAVAVAITVTMTISEPDDGLVDFGAVPGQGQPPLPADAGLRVTGADLALAPAPGSVLSDGGWDQAAAYVARNAQAGQPTIINLFASWCAPCEREMPLLNRVAAEERASGEGSVAFLGVAHLDARSDAERFVAEQRVEFTTILDLDGMIAAAVGGRGLPVTVAFDRDAVMVGRVFGELTAESLEELVALVR